MLLAATTATRPTTTTATTMTSGPDYCGDEHEFSSLGSSPHLLDFSLINPHQNKSIMGFFGGEAAVSLVAATTTNSQSNNLKFNSNTNDDVEFTDQADDDGVTLECAFCKKTGNRRDFRGRFCSKICVGRFAQRTRLMRKQNERRNLASTTAGVDTAALTSAIDEEDYHDEKPEAMSDDNSRAADATSIAHEFLEALEHNKPSSSSHLVDAGTSDAATATTMETCDVSLKEDEEENEENKEETATTMANDLNYANVRYLAPASFDDDDDDDQCDDMEIEIFKPTINYSNITDEFHSQIKTEPVPSPLSTSSLVKPIEPVSISDLTISERRSDVNKQTKNLVSGGGRSYSLRKKERKNSFLDRLQSQYDQIKHEPVIVKSPKKIIQQQTVAPTKLKRGRPSKKVQLGGPNLAPEPMQQQIVPRLGPKQSKHWLKMKENIRESVFLTKEYTNTSDFFKTVGFKIDSRLAIGSAFDSFNSTTSGTSSRSNSQTKRLRLWSVEEVSRFVAAIPDCEKFVKLFVSQEIDGEALILIKLDDLIRLMQIQLGPALKIFNYIAKLKYLTNSTTII